MGFGLAPPEIRKANGAAKHKAVGAAGVCVCALIYKLIGACVCAIYSII